MQGTTPLGTYTKFCSNLRSYVAGGFGDLAGFLFASLVNASKFLSPNNTLEMPRSKFSDFYSTAWLDAAKSLQETRHSHESYFNLCKPTACTYTITAYPNPLTLLTTILGLIGGLASSLKTILPLVFRCVPKSIYERMDRCMGFKTLPYEPHVLKSSDIELPLTDERNRQWSFAELDEHKATTQSLQT